MQKDNNNNHNNQNNQNNHNTTATMIKSTYHNTSNADNNISE